MAVEKFATTPWLLAAALALLAGCSPEEKTITIVQEPPAADATPTDALRFVPQSVEGELFEGDTDTYSFKAFPQYDFEGYARVEVADPAGTFQSLAVSPQEDGSYLVQLTTASGLSPGVHDGALTVRVCRDSVCSAEHPASPESVPYHLSVGSHTHLTPLVPFEGVAEWSMYQANAAHTGYLPVTLDPAKFLPRWIWRPADSEAARPGAVATAGGDVFTAVGGFFGPVSLVALKEADGTVHWEHSFGERFALNPPAVVDGKVHLASSGHQDTFMWTLHADGSGVLAQTPFYSQWEHYFAPTVHAGSVYTNGGYYGGANAFNASTGAGEWFVPLNQYDEWTPAVDDQYVYAYLGDSGLNVIDRVAGTLAFVIDDPEFDWAGWSVHASPIITQPGKVVTINGLNWYGNDLIRFDVATQSIDWSMPGRFMTQPAVAGGVIYVGNDEYRALEARSAATGALLWSWELPAGDDTGFRWNVVATDNVIFVSTAQQVYAVATATHALVWSYPYGGELALSPSGVLYVTRDDGALGAINLR